MIKINNLLALPLLSATIEWMHLRFIFSSRNYQNNRVKIFYFIGCWFFTSAFTVPCIYFCTDQTVIQGNYVKARDECRTFAEKESGIQQKSDNSQQTQTRLVTLFSNCMSTKGWTVPGPSGEAKAKDAAAPPPATAAAAAPSRAAECAYAREYESSSAGASRQARICDEECIAGLAQTSFPPPVTCPPEGSARMNRLKKDPRIAGHAPPIQPVKTKDKKPKPVKEKRPPRYTPPKEGTPEWVLEHGLHGR